MKAITTTTVQRIQALADELDKLGKSALDKAVEAGDLLSECKKGLAHGQWMPWLTENFQFSHKTAMNWMMISDASREGKLETVTTLTDAYRLMSKGSNPSPHVAQNSGENEWCTPPDFIESARIVMGSIDLDPASSETANRTVGASRFFTKEDDGTIRPWSGTVWMNPPYAQPLIATFSKKLAAEVDAGTINQAIALVNNATETSWFQAIHQRAAVACFPKSRIKFLGPDGKPGAPLQGQVFLYFGPNLSDFLNEFSKHGECVVKARPSHANIVTEIVTTSRPPVTPATFDAEIVEPEAQALPPASDEGRLPLDEQKTAAILEPQEFYGIILSMLPHLTKQEIKSLSETLTTRWLP